MLSPERESSHPAENKHENDHVAQTLMVGVEGFDVGDVHGFALSVSYKIRPYSVVYIKLLVFCKNNLYPLASGSCWPRSENWTKHVPLGERIRKLRTALGWSPGRLAKESGVSRAYLWQLETGGKNRPSLEILEKLAGALGVRASEFMDLDAAQGNDKWMPPGLAELVEMKRECLGITDGDIEVLQGIHFRGNRPKDPDDWELLFLFLKKWAR